MTPGELGAHERIEVLFGYFARATAAFQESAEELCETDRT
jgi:hypothetical protein